MGKRVLSFLLLVTLTAGMLMSCNNDNGSVVGADEDETGHNIVVVDVNLTDEAYGIGVDKDNPELLAKINEFIEKGIEDGTYDEITSHFFDPDKKPVPIHSAKLDTSKDQLVVATTGDFAPFDYDESDAYYGIDKELIKAIADYLGKELVLVNVNFDMIFMTVYQKKCDVCIAGITIKEEREKYVDFTVPYFHAGQCIAARADNNDFKDANTKEEVEKVLLDLDETKTIAVESETTGEEYLRGEDPSGFSGVKCQIKGCKSLNEALTELHNGEVDYVLGDSACLKFILATELSGK